MLSTACPNKNSCRVTDPLPSTRSLRLYSCFLRTSSRQHGSVPTITAASSEQAVDNMKTSQRFPDCSAFPRNRRIGVVAILSVALAKRNQRIGLPMLSPMPARMLFCGGRLALTIKSLIYRTMRSGSCP